MKFRMKPVEIEARQLPPNVHDDNYDLARDIATWCGGTLSFGGAGWQLTIPTLEGTMAASPADYVIRGVKGEFYPCKPDIFEATYELA